MAKLGALLIFTDQFDAQKAFYRDTLGLPVKDSDPGEGYKVGVDTIAFETGESMIELFDLGVHGGQLGEAAQGGRLVVSALDVGDVAGWLANNEGVRTLGGVREADWGTFIYVLDAEGNPIQVYEERAA
jgi:catechol 2,3-dioxygenase-like lactoylglutathione lyase family enzyme